MRWRYDSLTCYLDYKHMQAKDRRNTYQVTHPDLTFGALRRVDLPWEGPDLPRTMMKAPRLKGPSRKLTWKTAGLITVKKSQYCSLTAFERLKTLLIACLGSISESRELRKHCVGFQSGVGLC